MKTIKIASLSLAMIALAMLFLVPGCSNSHAEGTETSVAAEEPQFPRLLDRPDGLGTADEEVHVSGIYDKAVAQLRTNPADAKARLSLAELYINEARVSGEHPYYYPAAMAQIEALLGQELTRDQRFQALYMKATVELSLHDFARGLATGQQAVEVYPTNAGVHGVLVDAYTELGDYTQAVEMADKMVSIRPDLRSYSRISYLRELHGEVDGAIEAMKMAVSAAMPGYEQSAWCRLTLGNLYERYGQLDEAEMHYTICLQERPNYPFAIAALAGIEKKKGNLGKAAELLDKACAFIPEVGFYMDKADLLMAQGQEAEAQKLYAEIEGMFAEDAAAGHNMDLELAHFYLDIRNDTDKALAYAMKEYQRRPENIDVNATLAGIYFDAGQLDKAKEHLGTALRTQTRDPELLLLGGMIKLETGDKKAGKAMLKDAFAQNPYLDGPLATRAKDKV